MLANRRSVVPVLPILVFNLILLSVFGCYAHHDGSVTVKYTDRQNIPPPAAKVVPKPDTLHGDIRIDNYYWLRDRYNPEVIEYLEAENRYTETMMKHTEEFQEELYKEILSRIKETDLSVPEKLDDYYYYSRTEEGKQYPIYCRKKGNLDAEEEVLLDQNKLAAGYEYFDIGAYRVSPDHRFLVYSVDTSGSEKFSLHIKDLEKNELFKEKINNTGYYAAWANDNKTIYYTVLDDTKRPYMLYSHTLETNPEEDKLIYHEKDDAFFVYIFKTKDKKYLFMDLGTHTTSEFYFLNANNPMDDFKLIRKRESGVEYYVGHHEDKFFILTNDDAKNFKMMEAPEDNPCKESWKEIIAHRDSVKIDDFDIFKNHLVVYEREKGLQKIRIMNLTNNQVHYVNFPEPVYTYWKSKNPDFNTNTLRFNYTSLVTPRSVYDYNMDIQTRELKKQYEVLGGYDPALYESERIFARAQDGTMIPISLVYKKGMVKDGRNPLYLVGYGAYGGSYETYFSSVRLSLLNRGFVYAVAHVRGGGEMGRFWYEGGKLLNKMNTFTDFITCAEKLIVEEYTSSDKLLISGGSAGGMLIGGVTNMRPDLFVAVIADIPFLDVLNTMLDPSLPLTVLEYDEWGNPNDEAYYYYIKSYSPYDNIEPKDYPHMLITAGLNDTRVMYWEAAKWTAKLRALKTDKSILLLKTNMGAGHMGASGRYDFLKDIAFEYVFIFDLFGIEK